MPRPFVSVRKRTIPAHRSFLITQELIPSYRLPGILDDLRRDQLLIGGRPVELVTPQRNAAPTGAAKPTLWWHPGRGFADVELWEGRTPSSEPVRGFTLHASSGEASALVSQEEREALTSGLLKCRPRWLGFPDLLKRFLATPHAMTFDHNTNVSVEMSLRCEQGLASTEASGLLAIPIFAPAGLKRRSLRLTALFSSPSGRSWSRESPVQGPAAVGKEGVGQYLAHISTKDACSAVLHVILNNVIVDKKPYDLWHAKSPNPRVMALRVVGQASQELEGVLANPESKGRDSETFEIAVSNLFALCGFTTLNPGRKHARAGEAVDVVAIHPLAPVAFCIECTWKVVNNQGKLGKLHQRSREMARALPGFVVKPLLVTSKDDFTPTETAEAVTLGVTLLNRGHLQALRIRAEWNDGPTAVSRWLSGNQPLRIPES
jgi:hypothetical protein